MPSRENSPFGKMVRSLRDIAALDETGQPQAEKHFIRGIRRALLQYDRGKGCVVEMTLEPKPKEQK